MGHRQVRFPEPEDWQDQAWASFCVFQENFCCYVQAWGSALAKPFLVALSSLVMGVLRMPVLVVNVFSRSLEWLKAFAAKDTKEKIRTVGHGLGIVCNTLVGILGTVIHFCIRSVLICVKAVSFCVKSVVAAVRFVVQFTVASFCWLVGMLTFVLKSFVTFLIHAPYYVMVTVTAIVDGCTWFFVQSFVLMATLGSYSVAQLYPDQDQQHEAELLAQLKQEPDNKKGKPKKAVKGKQQQRQRPQQQQQRKGGATAAAAAAAAELPAFSPAAAPVVGAARPALAQPSKSDSKAPYKPDAKIAAGSYPQDGVTPHVTAKSYIGSFPQSNGGVAPIADAKLPISSAGYSKVDAKLSAQTDAKLKPAPILKDHTARESVEADVPLIRAAANSPIKAAANSPTGILPAKPAPRRPIKTASHGSDKPTASDPNRAAASSPTQAATSSPAKADDVHPSDTDVETTTGPGTNHVVTSHTDDKVAAKPASSCSSRTTAVKVSANANTIGQSISKTAVETATADSESVLSLTAAQHEASTAAAAAAIGTIMPEAHDGMYSEQLGLESDDADKCIVCWMTDRETTLAPCGHRVLCRYCWHPCLLTHTCFLVCLVSG